MHKCRTFDDPPAIALKMARRRVRDDVGHHGTRRAISRVYGPRHGQIKWGLKCETPSRKSGMFRPPYSFLWASPGAFLLALVRLGRFRERRFFPPWVATARHALLRVRPQAC